MNDEIAERVKTEAFYIADTGATVRKTAAVFGVSKSTVHKDVTERLATLDKDLHKKVKRVLQINLEERHIRGGAATKRKYLTI